MKIILALALSTALSGCYATLEKSVDLLSSPKGQQAAANAKAFGLGVTCALAAFDAGLVTVNDAVMGAVAATPALANRISNRTATAAQVVNGVVKVAYIGNAAACKALGGNPAVLQ